MPKSVVQIWKTIKLETTLKTVDDFRKALKTGYRIGKYANEMLSSLVIKAASRETLKETEVRLVKVSVSELGFSEGAEFREICQRAKEMGLEFCPAEVGPQLCLQYSDQLDREGLFIAMKPIATSNAGPSIFTIWRDEKGQALYHNYADFEPFDEYHVFVFAVSDSTPD